MIKNYKSFLLEKQQNLKSVYHIVDFEKLLYILESI